MQKISIERRRFRRLPMAVAVEVFNNNGEQDVKTFYTKDISPEGLRLVTTGNLDVGDKVDLQMYLPATTTILRASARIIRVESHDDEILQHAVLIFEDLDNNSKEALRHLYQRVQIASSHN